MDSMFDEEFVRRRVIVSDGVSVQLALYVVVNVLVLVSRRELDGESSDDGLWGVRVADGLREFVLSSVEVGPIEDERDMLGACVTD